MRLLVWNDGKVIEASEFRLPRAYVLERIHTLGHRAYNLPRHIMLMRESSAQMFGFMSLCRVEDADRIITKLLAASRVSPRLSCSVVMRLDYQGHLSFEVEAPSFYSGCSLRAKRPIGAVLPAVAPYTQFQTSVTVAYDAMCDSRVAGYGDIAIWSDSKDEVISIPWRPIFTVFHNRVYTPCEYSTVEYVVAAEAIAKAGFELIIHPIPLSALRRMEEVFVADVMGITSLLAVENQRLLFMVATQVAAKMEPKL